MTFDTKAFRQALGRFTTGITVVTTCYENQYFGVTINSFNSVSLIPPLVLFSLDKNSRRLEIFQKSRCFAVNVLSSRQQEISNRFAKENADFSGIELYQEITGSPLLPNSLATFDCQVLYQYEGGDHIIFVGNVQKFASYEGTPLLYYTGQYTTLESTSK